MWRRWFAVWLGALVSCAGFAVGFVNDDLVQRLWLEGKVADYAASPLSLYAFTGARSRDWLVEQQYVPWFTDPAWSLRFFRPLSSGSLWLDSWLFGRSALLAHVHSLIWFLVLAAAVVSLLQRWLPGRAGKLASVVYVLAGGQAMSMAWLASRHSLVGGALGALALLAHVRWREDGWRSGAWAGPLLLCGAFAGSEVALGAAVFIVLYELVERRDALASRARAALVGAAPTGAYLALYAGLGFGARGSAAYLSPFHDPGAYALASLKRVPELSGELYAALPSMLGSALPPTGEAVLAGVGALTTLLVAVLLYRAGAVLRPELSRRLWFLGLASVVCLVPLAGGFVGGRMLPLASLGAAAVLGSLLDAALRRWAVARGASRVAAALVLVGLALPHLGLATLVRLGLPLAFRQMEQAQRQLAETVEIDGCPAGSSAFVLTGSDPSVSVYGGLALAFYEPARAARLRGFTPLSMTASAQRLERVASDAFELTSVGDAAPPVFQGVYRQAPLQAGEVVRTRAMEVNVVAAEAGVVKTVRFRFYAGAEQACLLRWHRGALRRVELAEHAVLELPHEPGPSGF